MKKNISLIAFLGAVLFSTVAFGQGETVTAVVPTQNVTLNVKLLPVISLEIPAGQGEVNLVYKTAADYQSGVSVTKDGHLNVVSMGGYAVKAKAESNLKRTAGGEIPAGQISLKINDEREAQSLSTSEITLVSNPSATEGTSYRVTYKGIGDNAFKEKYMSGENPTVYSTKVTYSVEAI